jgi:hypothetical protein
VRGVALEAETLGHTPSLSSVVPNFPVIDDITNGVATSVKTIDLTAQTYVNSTSALKSTIRSSAQQLANFEGAEVGNIEVKASDITSKVLKIGVQPGAATEEQKAAISAIKAEVESTYQGVTVDVVEVGNAVSEVPP